MVASGDAPVEHMPAVLRVGPHLARPAPLVDPLRPALPREGRGAVVLASVASDSPRRAGGPSARPSSRPDWPGPGTSAPPTPARPDRATGPAARAGTA